MTTENGAKELTVALVSSDEDKAILRCKDSSGLEYNIRLNTMDIMTMIGALSAQMDSVKLHPSAKSKTAPFVYRLQSEDCKEMVFLRIFLGPDLYHEYSFPKPSNLARMVSLLGDEMQADNERRSTNPPEDPGKVH